jgi:hypothetical protein
MLAIKNVLFSEKDRGRGWSGHDDIYEGRQERGRLFHHAGLTAHRVP